MNDPEAASIPFQAVPVDGHSERAAVVADVIRTRRTVSLFDPARTVPREAVLRALELARWAPNHKLTQPWRCYLLGPETRAAVAHLNAEVVAAKNGAGAGENKRRRWLEIPGMLAVTYVPAADALRAQEDYAACAVAVQHVQLALWSEGIGTKWGTGDVVRDPRFLALLGADPAEVVVSLLFFGYPAALPVPPPRHPVEAFLSERP